MSQRKLELVALSITATKNPAICMVSTNKGMFSVRKSILDKRKISVSNEDAYKFPVPTVVVIDLNKVGDYIFGYDEAGKPVPAPEDSSRVNDQGEPNYKKGEFPKYTTDYNSVRTFVAFSDWKAQFEMDKLMKEMSQTA